MIWFDREAYPENNGDYLVNSFGIYLVAQYKTSKKAFTVGSGLDCEVVHVQAWAGIPKSIVYKYREIGESGDWLCCAKDWFDYCCKSEEHDTKKIEY